MTEPRAEIRVQAPVGAVSEMLLDAGRLPDWNPAFLAVAPAQAGAPGCHSIRVRGGLAGTFRYSHVSARRIEAVWQVRGLTETSYWSLREDGTGTIIEHGFAHRGILAAALRGAFATAADQRLSRLKTRLDRAA
jgi:hypothetical protein